ncbi:MULTISPECIES: LacI family DNA-binding transcriptional regulator [Microbacterium]|jgi:DNA-binding LacI/PurR family transcriptional regulator|uniref:LacI family transcriptional regulator n=1 Tax=Microbacterium algeriense TaxID=2615184 RepID=A0ABQ6V7M7_9MICO|nr:MULTISPECIES: LacI family DNA-binding transcriptional regulator [Microbacterium]AZH77034.1 transcriptional regulator [Microbacterium sp. Y-01]KAB1866427.1 LacI family transcriptional regulator [Microbacterium algeriense]MDX2398849.1 LacI family DNA-binding transcriptional regulator [Microbacterium algeriense]
MTSQETSRRPTIADVAREAGVATSTASVVFSGKANVAAATRERVLAAAAELGYAGPDPRAASLRRGRSGIVAVVLEGHLRAAFLDPVTTAMMDGLTDGLADLSAGILLMRDEPGEEGAAITHAPVDAFVLIGCSGRTRASLEVVVGRGLPVVVIEGDAGEEIPRITLDNVAASADVARHVRDLGHRDVALVTLPLDSERERALVTPERIAAATVDVTVHRLEGMRQVFPDAPAVSASGSLIDEGVLVGRMLLADPATRPTAVLAQSDLLAVGVIRAAEELGLRVPEDLSVAGFDGIEVDGLGELTLTTSVQPAVEKGRAAGEQVARMLGGEPGITQHLTCVFRAGTTTGPVPS